MLAESALLNVSVNRWIVFNWNPSSSTSSTVQTLVSVNRWIVFNWNLDGICRVAMRIWVSVNRWIVFNWNGIYVGEDEDTYEFQLIVG